MATNPTYRQWLQDRVYNGSTQDIRDQANALLQVVGDDGKIDANFVARSNAQGEGSQVNGYGADGMTRINNVMIDAYNSPNRQYSGDSANEGGNGSSVISGTSASTSAAEKAATIGQIDEQIAAIVSRMGNLDGTFNTGKTQISDATAKALDKLNLQQSQALSKYATQRSDTKRDFSKTSDEVNTNARNNYTALMNLLGRSGAGSSSAAENVVPYAVSMNASKSRGDASDTMAKNLRDVKTSEDETVDSYNSNIRDVQDQERTKLGELDTDITGKRAAYENEKATLQAQRVQAAGGNWAQAKAAMQESINRRNELEKSLATLLDKYRNPYTVRDVTVNEAKLDNYAYDPNGVEIKSGTDNSGYDTDTSAEYLARIAEEKKRKEEQAV